jgi:phenylacetate-CoA ligase
MIGGGFLKLYHALPPGLRGMAATAHGYRLRRARYGPESEEMIREALERETWSLSRIREWQRERLALLLRHASGSVPYYRDLWETRRRQGRSPEVLGDWPILEKEALRSDPAAFVAEGVNLRAATRIHTSGTTGMPLDLLVGRVSEREWWALFELRWRRWYGIRPGERWATIGGKVVTPTTQRKPPFWVWDASQSLLYLSTYHLAPDLIPYYLDAITSHRVQFLRGYSSSLYALAYEALRLGRRDLRVRAVTTYAEPLHRQHRAVISEAFGCPVRETYGMVEMTAAASECEHDSLHLWPEAGWLEVVRGDAPVPQGQPGELVATGLLNFEMPLIRYRVGDVITLQDGEERCQCGRTLPRLRGIQGRMDDGVYTRDGRRLGCLDVVDEGMPVRGAQVVQESLTRLHVYYVPAEGFTLATRAEMAGLIRLQMGDVEVNFTEVERIPRFANGKFRMVLCRIPRDERPAADREAA